MPFNYETHYTSIALILVKKFTFPCPEGASQLQADGEVLALVAFDVALILLSIPADQISSVAQA